MTINLIQPALPGAKVSSVWQRSSRMITCLYCQLQGRQVGDSLLCSNCLIDPVQTRTAIYLQQHGIDKQAEAATDAWLAFAEQHADDWDRIRAAQNLPDYAERCARHRAAGNIYGQLLDRLADRDRTLAQLGAERARLERALECLEGL